MKTTNLDKWLYLVRRIEEHREEKAVRELQKLYRSLIKDLRKVMGNIYADYADPETGKLTYADLHRQGLDARLLEEVAAHVSSVSSEEIRIIRETVEQTYANCYSGMVQAVGKAVDNEELKEAFSAVEAVKPEILRAAVNNPVHGLTLSDQLEKNRADIVWGIKQAVGVGLSEGDNYTTMAKRIQKELIGPDGSGGSYYKAVRIARTEAHRVREEGNLDAAQNLTEKLEPAGMTMVKTWHTMKDERVRPNRARKTKGGWKYSKGGKYDHQKMEGVQVPINEEFTLPSGAKTQAPGKSGVAGEDINCRCFLSYDVVQGKVQTGGKESGGHYYPDGENDTKRDKQANRAYEKYCKVDDSEIIARNSGFKVEDVRQIRSHVFFKKHDLYVGYSRFPADYDMAVAWKRLQEGRALPRDITLLHHELLESQLEIKYNLNISEAHAKASEQYDWWAEVVRDLGEGGEPDGLL